MGLAPLKSRIVFLFALAVFSSFAPAVPERFQHADKLRRLDAFLGGDGFDYYFMPADFRNTENGLLENGVLLQTYDPMRTLRLIVFGVFIWGEVQNDMQIRWVARFLTALGWMTGAIANASERSVYFLPISAPELKQLLSNRENWEAHERLRQPDLTVRQHAQLRGALVWRHTLSLRRTEHLFDNGPVELEKIHFSGRLVPQTRSFSVEEVSVDVKSIVNPEHRRSGVSLNEIKTRPNCRSFFKALLQL